MKNILGCYVLVLLAAAPASAQQPPSPSDPEKQALAYEVQDCQAGKLRTTTAAFQIQARLEAETKRADQEKKRADEAEAKLKAEPKPAEAK